MVGGEILRGGGGLSQRRVRGGRAVCERERDTEGESATERTMGKERDTHKARS